MRGSRILRLTALLLAGLGADASAQDTSRTLPPLSPGMQVRVWSRETGNEGRTGVVTAASADTLHVALGRSRRPLTVPADSVWRLEVSRDRSRVPGALLGGTIGLVTAAALGWGTSASLAALFPDCAKCVFGPTPEERERWDAEDRRIARTTGMITGGLGLVAGAVIGSRYLGHRYERVEIALRIGMGEGAGAAGLGVALYVQ
jgi:hypothetical protein